mmetsp:Transcript_28402/g.60515  ORF Transcript_28402/g.60515 Transcript_28402/m.60515 type:complete len:87 (+) Transcript_28402:105-365(+)
MAATNVSNQQILSAIDAIQEEAVDFLKTIVAIDSTLEKGEGEVQSVILDHLVNVLGSGDSSIAVGEKKRQRGNVFEVDRFQSNLIK